MSHSINDTCELSPDPSSLKSPPESVVLDSDSGPEIESKLYIDNRPKSEDEPDKAMASLAWQPVQMVRIFGVNIFKMQSNGDGGRGGCVDSSKNSSSSSSFAGVNGDYSSGKRNREVVEMLSMECSNKKQMFIGAL
ncbi:hypothetical protein SAY87_017915 [Trapa incisa]|uniref:Uncharacterized protein n=1 Tax=Trapa incisa TaxID=236973 RepID=A0AAN7L7E0_9MYRT|nr:hypothetical protein SAY87_017915 [Trapa incisa]